QGLGAKVTIYSNEKKQGLEQMPTKGYLSTVTPILNFGLGQEKNIDSLNIEWNSGKKQVVKNPETNRMIVLEEKNAESNHETLTETQTLLTEIPSPIHFKDIGSNTNDFKRQGLLIHQLSHSGPYMVKGDINNDGLEDVFIGGAKGQSAALYLQQQNKTFQPSRVTAFDLDRGSHDTDAVIFDANGDGHADIYVTSGGYHDFLEKDPLLQDRLYLGNGNGNFAKSDTALPKIDQSTSCAIVNDINEDGHLDLFIGGTVVPGRYPETLQNQLLINDGKGNFTDQIKTLAPDLQKIGMVTDALWTDMNGDKVNDLIVVGEWMPISIFINTDGTLENKTSSYLDKNYSGWWNTITASDFNGDGKPDFIVGNMGLNTQFKVSNTEPAELYYGDFDKNGSVDPLFSYYIKGVNYPYLTRDELLGQLAGMRSRYTSYKSYANATIATILSKEELNTATKLTANHMETTLFLSTAQSHYEIAPLPIQAQYSPVNSIPLSDFDGDGNIDMLLLGNNDNFKLRLGKFDANYGTLLMGNGKGAFEYIEQTITGLNVSGSVNSSVIIDNLLFLGVYGEPVKAYKILKPNSKAK
ncbi:MAG: FG-GAP-like repeat-containing protein, partial [Flavobacteriaceae bacterium]